MCRFCARKRSETCPAARYPWERLATKPCTGWLWKLTGSKQNDYFVDLKPIFNRAIESVEQVSLFVHANLAVIFIEHGKTIIWGIIKYHK